MMEKTVFIFLFLWHELEEILIFPPWIAANRQSLKKFLPPPVHRLLSISRRDFAAIASWEFCLLVGICLFLSEKWLFGAIFAYSVHLIIHLGQGFWLYRHNFSVPLLSSVPLGIPACTFLLWHIGEDNSPLSLAMSSLAMTIFVVTNLVIAHYLRARLSRNL